MNVNDRTNFLSIRKYIDSGHKDSLYKWIWNTRTWYQICNQNFMCL